MSADSYSVKSPTISIIVPVHNAEMDLPRCLDSLCTQSYENYEIICVENASSDGSWHVLQQYAAQNERIKLMHRDKAGVSGARNTALELVQGDIVGFCDADDMYTQGAFQYVAESFKLKGWDILTTGYKAVTSPPPVSFSRVNHIEECADEVAYSGRQLQEIVLTNDKVKGFLWNKFFRKELIQGFLLHEELTHAEDLHFISQILHRYPQSKVVCSQFVTYTYIINPGSATQDIRKLFNEQGKLRYLEAYERMLALYAVDSDMRNLLQACCFRLATENIKCVKKYPQIAYTLAKEAQSYTKQYLMCTKLPLSLMKRIRKCIRIWSIVLLNRLKARKEV